MTHINNERQACVRVIPDTTAKTVGVCVTALAAGVCWGVTGTTVWHGLLYLGALNLAIVLCALTSAFTVGLIRSLRQQARAPLSDQLRAAEARINRDAGRVIFQIGEPIDLGVAMTSNDHGGGRLAVMMFATREPARGLYVVPEPRHVPALMAALRELGQTPAPTDIEPKDGIQ